LTNVGNLDIPVFEADIIQQLGDLSEQRVLELGCATGPHARLLSDSTRLYIASDILLKKLKDSRRSDQSVDKLIYLGCDGSLLPFGNDSFDRIVMVHFLHELDCSLQSKVMKEIHRVLVPIGRIVIIDTVAKTTNFQQCFDIVHENYQFFNHSFNLQHSKWIINKFIERNLFFLLRHEQETLEFHFQNIAQVVNLLIEEFKYEYSFTDNEKGEISRELLQIIPEKNDSNSIIINELLDIYLLENNK